jgi:hypothetical protein
MLSLLWFRQEGTPHMLTGPQQLAIDRFAKSLQALGDDSLIDAYHQAWEDGVTSRGPGPRR